MTVEQRLQHAARELREIDVPVPPLPGGARRASRGGPMVAVTAVVLAGVAAVVSVAPGSRTTIDAPMSARPAESAPAERPLLIDPRAEVALITSLADDAIDDALDDSAGDDATVRPVPPGVV